MVLSTTTAKTLYVSVWIFTLRRKWKGKCESVVPGAYCQSNTIHPANVTHSIRGSKTLSRRRPTTAPQERSGFLSKSSFFLFVSFQLCNEQLQRGITTNFKQGQIKVHSPKPHHILSKGKVYSTLITLLFPSFLKYFSYVLVSFFFFIALFYAISLCSHLLFAPVWFALRASGWDIVMGVMVCDLSFLHSFSSCSPLSEWLYACETICVCFHYTVWPPPSVWM